MSFTEREVAAGRRLMDAGRLNRLEIGDFLNAAAWAADQTTLGHFCERIGLSLRSAREYMQTAAAADELLRQAIDGSGVHVSYSVLREGGLFGADPGFKVLRGMLDEAKTSGADQVRRVTYQTLLGKAPSLDAIMDPAKRRVAGHVQDYVSALNASPDRQKIIQAIVATDAVTRAEVTAELDRQRAERAEGKEQNGPPRTSGKVDAGTVLLSELGRLRDAGAGLKARFPGVVKMTAEQKNAATALIGDLDFFTTWARLVTGTASAASTARASQREAAAV